MYQPAYMHLIQLLFHFLVYLAAPPKISAHTIAKPYNCLLYTSLKQIIPTEKAEKIRPAILKSIEEGEAKMLRGIPKEDVEPVSYTHQMCIRDSI